MTEREKNGERFAMKISRHRQAKHEAIQYEDVKTAYIKGCEDTARAMVAHSIADIQNAKKEAREIIKDLKALYYSPIVTNDDVKRQDKILAAADQFLAGYEAVREAGKQPEKTHQNCKHYHGDVVTAFEDKDYDNPCLTCFKFDKWEAAE